MHLKKRREVLRVGGCVRSSIKRQHDIENAATAAEANRQLSRTESVENRHRCWNSITPTEAGGALTWEGIDGVRCLVDNQEGFANGKRFRRHFEVVGSRKVTAEHFQNQADIASRLKPRQRAGDRYDRSLSVDPIAVGLREFETADGWLSQTQNSELIYEVDFP